ncbi:MAG: prepilin peptidase [Actinobacteria bacterium]|nr:prepilin peptidase [Actinomycetota bacterium]
MGTGPVKAFLLWVLALSAAYHDLRWRKVPNRLILAGLICGTAAAALGGFPDLLRGMEGILLGTALLLPFFLLGGVGGGDVKSLAVIGLFTGPSLLLTSFFWGACAGGGLALLSLAVRRAAFSTDGVPEAERPAPPTLPYAAILFLSAAIFLTRAAA